MTQSESCRNGTVSLVSIRNMNICSERLLWNKELLMKFDVLWFLAVCSDPGVCVCVADKKTTAEKAKAHFQSSSYTLQLHHECGSMWSHPRGAEGSSDQHQNAEGLSRLFKLKQEVLISIFVDFYTATRLKSYPSLRGKCAYSLMQGEHLILKSDS